MKKFRIALSAVIATLLGFAAAGHEQTSIAITNFSFESNSSYLVGGLVTGAPDWVGCVYGSNSQKFS